MKYNLGRVSTKNISKGLKMIKENGGNVYPDGRFSIKGVEGTRDRHKGDCIIRITKQPDDITNKMIENKLIQFFT